MASEPDHREVTEAERDVEYTEAEAEQILDRSLRSDWPSVVIRLATIATTYGLLARAIVAAPLPAMLIVLPFIVELIALFWLGLFLAAFVIDDKVFRANALRPLATIFWTGFLALGPFLWLTLSTTHGDFEIKLENIEPNFAKARHLLFDSGLYWALVAVIGGLILTTLFDVLDWKRRGGPFAWPSSATAGFRLFLAIFSLPLLIILGGFFEPLIAPWYSHAPAEARAWVTWGVLLLLEIAVVVVTVLIHRHVRSKGTSRSARANAHTGLPA